MAIFVEVEDYCENCPDFLPDVHKLDMAEWTCGDIIKHDTTIKCIHRHRCRKMVAYLKHAIKE